MLTDIRNTLKDIYEPERTPENPLDVANTLIDSPLPGEYSPDRGMAFTTKALMSRALLATSKDDDPESKKNRKKRHFTVEVRASPNQIDMSNTGWTDASISSGFTPRVLDHLSPCVAKLFQPYFAEYNIDGVMVNIPNHAAFIQGIPKTFNLVITPAAVTLGPYNIHYDTNQLSLSSPTWDGLRIIAEELSHAEQFLKMWQDMRNVPGMAGSIRQGTTSSPSRRPNYEDARGEWAIRYGLASAAAVALGRDSYYGNSYEIDAQANARRIIADLGTKHPQQYATGAPLCP